MNRVVLTMKTNYRYMNFIHLHKLKVSNNLVCGIFIKLVKIKGNYRQ